MDEVNILKEQIIGRKNEQKEKRKNKFEMIIKKKKINYDLKNI